MKFSKWFAVIVITTVLCTFLPAKPVQAYVAVTTNTTITTSGPLTSDLVISNGATLTIQSGVTITVSCTDSAPYATGVDSQKVEIIIENGTLIAGGVTFLGAESNSCWRGIRILENGDAEITRSTIRDARIGIEIYRSSPTITSNTIENIRGEYEATVAGDRNATGISVSEADPGLTLAKNTIRNIIGGTGCTGCELMNGGTAYGIMVTDSDSLTIEDNLISGVYGGNAGWWFSDGSDGAAGANGTSLEDMDGEQGSNGSDGHAGGIGGDATGIHLVSSSQQSVSILGNTITGIYGGDGNKGTGGGDGGRGGNGFTYSTTSLHQSVNGGFGGVGGTGGSGGAGGDGGNAYGIFGSFLTAAIAENEITTLEGGASAIGGLAGTGGTGGTGGNGAGILISGDVQPAGHGGAGGNGGAGGIAGDSGNGGSALGVTLFGGSLMQFQNNTISGVQGMPGSAGVPGGAAGNGGTGGRGGNGTSSYPYGGGGGRGGGAGAGGQAGNGGDGGAVYGLYLQNVAVTGLLSNTIAKLNAGIGGAGGNGSSTVRTGGIGGGVGEYPSVSNPLSVGGDGGNGGAGGQGGTGGIAGFAFGIYGEGLSQNIEVVNNLLYDIYSPSGGNGGSGGQGGNGGNGGPGAVSPGTNRPGGDGGNGGAGGNGGDGGENVYGVYINNVGSILLMSVSAPLRTVTLTNNTIANNYADDTDPVGGTKGIPGSGGSGGTGNPTGSAGTVGATGYDGIIGEMGQVIGYFSNSYTNSSLYNNIFVNLVTPIPANTTGLYKHPASSFAVFRNGNIWGWHNNYGNTTGIDQTGSISANPLFVDYQTEDYHLQSGSPCVDTGSDSAPSVPSIDLGGSSRPSGAHVDMGAYEFASGTTPGDNLNYLPLILR